MSSQRMKTEAVRLTHLALLSREGLRVDLKALGGVERREKARASG